MISGRCKRADLDRHRPHRHEKRHAGLGIVLVQEGLGRDPFAGDVFVFRGTRWAAYKSSMA